MERRMTWLTNKLQSLRDQISKEDYINWLAMTETKMLFLHLEIDLEEHKDKWACLAYADNDPKNLIALGQTSYIMELEEVVRSAYEDYNEEEDDNDEG